MKIEYYQSLPELGIQGRFDMEDQFKILPDVKGKSVLEIGCNTGAFLVEAKRRGATKCVGVEPNRDWRILGNGIMNELGLDISIFDDVSKIKEKFDVVLLLSVLHIMDGGEQKLLDTAYELTNELLIVEINDRLQNVRLNFPKGEKYATNKDNRSVHRFPKV